MSGLEALLQGIVNLRRMDGDADTAAFISGYRGSPLGGFDTMLWQNQAVLDAHRISFKPGLNEDLAATACWGTQQIGLVGGAKRDGVTAFWYGKGPGVDRAGDVIKHASAAGTAAMGGVVMLVGDDHGGKSSTLAHQSDQALIAAGIPVLFPATIQEYADLLPFAAALSRFASVWVGFKCVTETVESSMVVTTDCEPARFAEPAIERPAGGFHIKGGFVPLELEKSLSCFRLPAAQAFVKANKADQVMWDADKRGLGLIAAGKPYVDLLEALRLLGITRARAFELGIRIYKPLMIWPLIEATALDFAHGHREVMLVEEKRGLMEEQLGHQLHRLADHERPRISGKRDPDGEGLLPDYGELSPKMVARAIGARLVALGIADSEIEARWHALDPAAQRSALAAPARTPAFCSGCPHNRSTRLPDGSIAFGGIGCHGMALFVPELRTISHTQMGGEGANWIGIADYVNSNHIFQNLGDGTYAHSGSLAIRAMVAAGSTITYKILHNGATAMTGGQVVEGDLSAVQIARQLLAEGVAKVALVTENPRQTNLPPGLDIHPRDALAKVQEQMREIAGVTAIIYEQGCAAERRRLRKAGQYPDPAVWTYINPAVCEGCGDCGKKSSCVSIVPVETEEGRKRAIEQESCNKDYTCVEGFCPSFVTVKNASPARRGIDPALVERIGAALADPASAPATLPWNIVLAGIGGNGIVTLGSIIARAARADGYDVSTFDVTGLAQKNGPVYAHIRLLDPADPDPRQPRVPAGQLDLLIGADIMGSSAEAVLQLLSPERSRVVVSSDMVPSAGFQRDPDQAVSVDPYADALAALVAPGNLDLVASSPRLHRHIGRGPLLNVMMLGYAVQRGALPIKPTTIEGLMVRKGQRDTGSLFAFRVGRLTAQDPDLLEELLADPAAPERSPLAMLPTEAAIRRCCEILTTYQNGAYAERYERFVRNVAQRDPKGDLTREVALNLFRLMRYKDEYEIARLYADPAFMAGLKREFDGDMTLSFNLAPPILPLGRNQHGEPRKIKLGRWALGLFRLLARFKFLRGTPFDPFGMLHDRREERRLIAEYCAALSAFLGCLDQPASYDVACQIAALPDQVRGYGPVKDRSIAAMRAQLHKLIVSV